MLTTPLHPPPPREGRAPRPLRRRPRPPRAASPPPPRDRRSQPSAAAWLRPARGPRAVSARLRLAPPAPRRAPAGGPRSTKKPIPLFARRAPSGHRAPQKAPSVPTAAPRRAAGWGRAKGEAVEGVSGDAERGGRRAARTEPLASRSARAAISRSTSATRPFSAAVWSSVCGIAPRYAASRPLRADRSAPPAACSLLRANDARRGPAAPRACARLRPPAPARRKPPPDSPDLWIPALQSLRTRTRTRPCAAVRTPPVLCAPPAPRPLLLCSSPAPRSAPSVTVTG